MEFYRTCSRCGSHLDPGEHCDCGQEEKRMRERFAQKVRVDSKTGQLSFMSDERNVGYVAKGTY